MSYEELFTQVLNYLNNDDVIIYPTSTLPALGCKPNKKALDKLFKIKNRSIDLPVSLGVLDLEQVSDLIKFDSVSIELLEWSFIFPNKEYEDKSYQRLFFLRYSWKHETKFKRTSSASVINRGLSGIISISFICLIRPSERDCINLSGFD